MTKTEFFKDLENKLELSDPISSDTNLKELEEFDSMAVMSLVAYIHKTFGKQFNARQLNNITSVQSLIELIGPEVFNG
jgi:acyl carrier protein